MALDYAACRSELEAAYDAVQGVTLESLQSGVGAPFRERVESVFASRTQAYREALLGCAVAKLVDQGIDVRLPHTDLGAAAFSGRSVDEQAVNPFFRDHEIPSSRSPYLSALRRGVDFRSKNPTGQRDLDGFNALVDAVEQINTATVADLNRLLQYLVRRFLDYRDASRIPVAKIQKLSLAQIHTLMRKLLAEKSGGVFPVLLVIAVLKAQSDALKLDWTVTWQGINAADGPSGAAGDVTVTDREGATFLVAEVTERVIDRNRVIATFRSKVTQHNLEDYLFIHSDAAPESEALKAAERYFSQGHELIFVNVLDWTYNLLASLTVVGRRSFVAELIALVDSDETPARLKVAWNGLIRDVLALQAD
jgi:hypothetical protein